MFDDYKESINKKNKNQPNSLQFILRVAGGM